MKKFDKSQEEVVSSSVGYPYNILPKGYPNKIGNQKIQETIDKIFDNLKGNAGIETIVNRDTALISLGLNELNNRTSGKESRIAFWLSTLSVILAGASLLVAMLGYFKDKELDNNSYITPSPYSEYQMLNDR